MIDPFEPLPADRLAFARELRQRHTDSEKLLWALVRNRGLGEFKFRRQHPVDPYVLKTAGDWLNLRSLRSKLCLSPSLSGFETASRNDSQLNWMAPSMMSWMPYAETNVAARLCGSKAFESFDFPIK